MKCGAVRVRPPGVFERAPLQLQTHLVPVRLGTTFETRPLISLQIFRYFHLLIPSSLWAACNIETNLQNIHEYFKKAESGQEKFTPGNLFIEHQSVKGVR